jgi:hypothetical protein
VRNQFFVSTSKHQLKKIIDAISTSHLIFCPPSAVDVYDRPQGADRVEVGRGSSGRQCHDGGEGQHEVSPCLVLTKSLVSISKIHLFR